jgi:hypothetical protein
MPGSEIVWWDAGHWPNLATQFGVKYQVAAAEFLAGSGVSAELAKASAEAEAAIVQWDAPPPLEPPDEHQRCVLANLCVLM